MSMRLVVFFLFFLLITIKKWIKTFFGGVKTILVLLRCKEKQLYQPLNLLKL